MSVTVCGCAAVADPLSVTVVGELVALLTNDTVPMAAPLIGGANTMLAVLLVAGSRVNGKLSPLRLNPNPVVVADDTVTPELPVSVRVMSLRAEAPATTEPKAIEEGDNARSIVEGASTVTVATALALGSARLLTVTV